MKGGDTAPRVLVVDDDPDLLDLIGMRLESAGYAVTMADSGASALSVFRTMPPRVVITDVRMDGMDGHALYERLHAEAPSIPVIMLTAHGTIPDAVAATQRGVFSFLTKPFDGQILLERVAAALALSPPIAVEDAGSSWRQSIVSASGIMDELLRKAHRLGEQDASCLICGPRGSGKELLARVIHGLGASAGGQFCTIRCGSETAGDHAAAQFAGQFTAARGGTLFLDDIDQLHPVLQARLLPLVADVGMFGTAQRNMRVIASSSQALDAAVRGGDFRADLFYTLSRNTLVMPALSERREDIPLLVAHFIAAFPGQSERGVTPEAMTLLCEAPWPGNVRQLGNVIEHALAHSVSVQVPATTIRRLLQDDNAREMTPFDDARRSFECEYLETLLKSTAGNVAQAARIAQRNRTEFYKLLARHGIDPGAYKPVR